jgi:hypothetical protein
MSSSEFNFHRVRPRGCQIENKSSRREQPTIPRISPMLRIEQLLYVISDAESNYDLKKLLLSAIYIFFSYEKLNRYRSCKTKHKYGSISITNDPITSEAAAIMSNNIA